MRRQGHAARTELYDMDLLQSEDKASVSFYFSGKPIDLEATRKILASRFPLAYVEEQKDKLRIVIPFDLKTSRAGARALVEKVLDATHSKLSYHYTLDSKRHGSKRMPELCITLDDKHNQDSFYGQEVLDIISRRIDKAKTHDPLKNYTYGPNKDGSRIVITPTDEVCETHEQAIQYGSMMMSHFKHHLEESAHHVQLTSLDPAPPEERIQVEGKQTIALTLNGDERELRLIKWNLARSENLRTALVPDRKDPMKLQLNIYADINNHLNDIIEIIRTVHKETGCRLPINTAAIVVQHVKGKLPSGEDDVVFYPATAMLFNNEQADYDPILVQALAIYASSYTKNRAKLTFPTATLDDGSGREGILLSQPTTLVVNEAYTELSEAWGRALGITTRLNALLQHDEPEQSQETRMAM